MTKIKVKASLREAMAAADTGEANGDPINVGAIAHDAQVAADAATNEDERATMNAIADAATKLEKPALILIDDADALIAALDENPSQDALRACGEAVQRAKAALATEDNPVWQQSVLGSRLSAAGEKLMRASYLDGSVGVAPPAAHAMKTSLDALVLAIQQMPDDIPTEAALSELSDVEDRLLTLQERATEDAEIDIIATMRSTVKAKIAQVVERKRAETEQPEVTSSALPLFNHITSEDFLAPREFPAFIKDAPAEQRNAALIGYFMALNDMLRHGALPVDVFNAMTDRRIAVRHFQQAGVQKDGDLQAIINCVLNG